LLKELRIFAFKTEAGRLNVLVEIGILVIGILMILRIAPRARYSFLKQLTLFLVVGCLVIFGKVYCFDKIHTLEMGWKKTSSHNARPSPTPREGPHTTFPEKDFGQRTAPLHLARGRAN
jgi:hypothetical protein